MKAPSTLCMDAIQRPRTAALALLMMSAAVAGASAQAAPRDAGRDNAISFTASASEELIQDQMTVTLQVLKEGAAAADVQSSLKAALDAALAEARKAVLPNGALDVKTGGFSVSPRYGNTGKINGWQGSAQLIVEGTDAPRISQLVGRLNQLNVMGVSYGLSRAQREAHESSLTSQAIARFRTRAQQMARDFGFKSYSLGEISVSSTDPGFEGRPVMYAMRAKSAEVADAPLPVEPGKGMLSVTVSGQVILAP
ncbi:MAG: SIMPL domain-containing protein [Acidobacteriota bacterium]